MTSGRSLCFYSGVRRPEDFHTYPWYGTDVQILTELGFTVHASKTPFDIPLRSDVYLAWWPTSGMLPLAVAKARRKPFVLIAGGDDVVTAFKGFGYWERNAGVRGMIKTTVTQADHVIAVSQHAAEQVKALGAKRVTVVYNAIDIEKFSPRDSPSDANRRDILCIVAQLSSYYLHRKPVATLIQALPKVLERHPSARLVIIGRAAEGQPDLQRLASEANVSHAVEFLGAVSEEEKLNRLRSAFAYAQPTIHEAFGVAIAEAMSCGLPVVVSPAGAVPEVVGECGLFADAHDPDSFARQILFLMDNSKAAVEFGRAARNRIVADFSLAERRDGFARVMRRFL